MTTIYFIRHAEAVRGFKPNRLRPLTEKGQKDCHWVTEFLQDKQVDVIVSSTYKRAVDTVSGFAKSMGFEIELDEDFREREKGSLTGDYMEFAIRQWGDFLYKLNGGESLAETQQRNITALQRVLERHKSKNIVIGTHGQALGTIINYFDESFGFEQKLAIGNPHIVKMIFDGDSLISFIDIGSGL